MNIKRRRFLVAIAAAAVAPKAELAARLMPPGPQQDLILETRVFSVEEICRLFDVPVELVLSEREMLTKARAKKRKAGEKKK